MSDLFVVGSNAFAYFDLSSFLLPNELFFLEANESLFALRFDKNEVKGRGDVGMGGEKLVDCKFFVYFLIFG